VLLSRIQADFNLSQAYHAVFAVEVFPQRLAGMSDGERRVSSFVAGCMRACNGILGHCREDCGVWPLCSIGTKVSVHYFA
jgi:hypothetical protein